MAPGTSPVAHTPAAALLSLQRAAGNTATTALVRSVRSAPTAVVQRVDGVVQHVDGADTAPVSDPEALAAVNALPAHVLSGGGGVPLTTDTQKGHFLRAGLGWFGTVAALVAHYSAIEQSAVPGRPWLHRDAKVRLEGVATALEGPMPSSSTAFAFRKSFDANTKFTPASMHTLGYAIDYDATNMPQIGKAETAELVRSVTGAESHADLGEYGQRRALIRATGDATAGDPDAAPSPAAQAHFDRLRAESGRLAQTSAAFQASLGDNRDAFLDLRTRYFEATTDADRAALLAQVPALIAPWTAAITAEEQRIARAAAAAGLDAADLPSRQRLTTPLANLDAVKAAAVRDQRAVRHAAEPAETSPAGRRLAQWEQKLDLTASGGYADRLTAVVNAAEDRRTALAPLLGAREQAATLTSLRAKLATPAYLFGQKKAGKKGTRPTTAAAVASPSMAQLVERGFYNPRERTAGSEHFDAEFLVQLARHGFDGGLAWGGESTDSMHMELVVDRPAAQPPAGAHP